MKSILQGLLRLVVLSLLIVMPHELGHYAAMRFYDVRVVQIAIGFGPTIWSHTMADGLVISVKPILLGGFTEPAVTGPHNMLALPAPQMFVTFMAGMFVNATLAFLGILFLGRKGIGRPKWARAPQFANTPHSVLLTMIAFKSAFVDWLVHPWRALRAFISTVRGKDADPNGFDLELPSEPSKWEMLTVSFIFYNVLLAQFNLLPFEPLDGGNAFSLVMRMTLGPWAEHLVDRWSMALFGALIMINAFCGMRNSKRAREKKEIEKLQKVADEAAAARDAPSQETPSE